MAKKKQMLLIINPKSGRGLVRNHLLEITDTFVKAGYQVQIHITQRALDARDVVIRDGAKKELIVCSGGDGTLNETITGMMQLKTHPHLGYIPAGSTNDFASSLKIPKQMGAAAMAAAYGSEYPIDIGEFCQERYFVYVAGFGAFTEVSYLTPQDKKNVLGHQAYMLESVKGLTSIKAYRMKVQTDEMQLEGDFIFGMVTNTISVGGFKGLVDQNAALNDGLFEVLLIRMPKTPLEFSNIVSSLFLKDEKSEQVCRFKTRAIRFTCEEPVDWVLDGEFGGARTEVYVENLHRRMEIRRSFTPKTDLVKAETGKLRKQR
ncbi:MAG: YegS/Rv2252/BmrU family lipid kinase [Eubacteriales bacterium]|nr:YegS/Rv2252/BmrU family lipid kinase [Eubacteriales bacterium]